MSEHDDPIRRADALGAATPGELIAIWTLVMLELEKPGKGRMARVLRLARNERLRSEIIRLHSAEACTEWPESFRAAELRIAYAAEILRRETAEPPKTRER